MRVLEFKASHIPWRRLQRVLDTVQFSGSAAGQILCISGTSYYYYVNTSRACMEAIVDTLKSKGISYRQLNYPTKDVLADYKDVLAAARRTGNYC